MILNKIYKLLFICIFFCVPYMQNIEITNIEIEGLQRLDKDDIYRISKLYPGIVLSRGDEINQAINKLWGIGRFSNIQVFLKDEKKNSVSIKILLEELPVIGEIKFIGNRKIKDRTLIDIIKINHGQILSENALFEAKKYIIEKYMDDRYYNAEVDFEIENTDIDYIKNVNFSISEGKKSRIKKINITGNNNFSYLIPKVFKNTKEFSWFIPWRGKYNKDLFDEDLKNLELFYKNNGYRDFKILNKEVNFNQKNIEINIDIYEGKKYFYKSINFYDNEKFTDNQLLDVLDIDVGDVYSKENLDYSIYENITSLYMDEGHYFFNIIKEEIPDVNDSLIINLRLNENQKVKIRKIFINGNEKTIENVIRRELKIYPGDIFNRNNIIESMKSLYMLNYFEAVEPQILTISDSEIDIGMNVVEKETGRANFSMGYNELNGFSGGGGFEFINFLGRGLRLAIDYQKGLQNQINQGFNSASNNNSADYESFSISFTEPRIFDSRNSIGFSIYNMEQGARSGYSEYDTRYFGGSLTFGRQFKWPDYYTAGSWQIGIRTSKYYGTEEQLIGCNDVNSIYYPCDFSLDDIKGTGDNLYAQRDGIKFTQTISRTNIDNAEFPTDGSKLVWSSTLSGGFLGGNENYHKHTFNFNWYTPASKKIVLYQNYTFGAIKPLVEDEYINSRTRFSMGGSGIPYGEMLRGYLDNSIGSQISYYSRGGNIMMKYSAELRFLVSSAPTIYVILFADAGNIWADFNNIDIFDLKRSAGIGIRLNMPMLGMIGYDIGYGFDHHDDHANKPWGWEQHLIFGVPLN